MTSTMVESSTILVNSWIHRIQSEGGVADIEIYEDIRRLSGEIISRACFGSNYSKGEEIFSKLRALQALVSDKSLLSAIPVMRCLPTKRNRKIQSLGKEIREMLLKIVNDRLTDHTAEADLLQMILEGAKNGDLDNNEIDNFIVDNCKNIYLAGYETSSTSAVWTLMLLALNPEWQTRVRAEISEVCGKQLPNAAILPKMKTLTMVINESMRLYPTAPIITREALQEMKFGGLTIPKGVTIWTFLPMLHQDPEIWGPDANKFNPERFANGVTAACKLPQVFMPFGFGPRLCLGMPFALAELKILLTLLISNFSFSISPTYQHSPVFTLVLEPEQGMNLLVKRV
ncbi:unnamed protein product [Ilex paraguariensis]|uniref:Cytochrome P450 n=1 Tax=Ilex paraguariensis TaxID=185542 RepID=A0ABC8UXF1_9AQUA